MPWGESWPKGKRRLTARQAALIQALLENPGVAPSVVGQGLGYRNSSVSVLLHNEFFKTELEKARAEWRTEGKRVTQDCKGRLQRLIPKAMDVVKGILEDEGVAAEVRLRAAEIIFDRGGLPRESRNRMTVEDKTPWITLLVQASELGKAKLEARRRQWALEERAGEGAAAENARTITIEPSENGTHAHNGSDERC